MYSLSNNHFPQYDLYLATPQGVDNGVGLLASTYRITVCKTTTNKSLITVLKMCKTLLYREIADFKYRFLYQWETHTH